MILLALALAAAQPAPPPGWDIGNSFAKDVCTERDSLRSDAACYAAWLVENERIRRLLCHGPVAVIADDDPGLVLYLDGLLEERKITLATNRGEACSAEELSRRSRR